MRMFGAPLLDYRRAMRIASVALAALLPVLAACSSQVPDTQPSATTSASVTTTPQPDLTSAPTTPPIGDPLTFDQAADYEDGLSIQVDNVRADTAPDEVTGAEGTAGQVVLAEVVVTNGTREAYDATTIVVQGYYRGNVGAVMLADPSGEIGQGFGESVPRGEQHKARVGFAVPVEDADEVTIVVDPRDGHHAPVRFEGSAIGN